jgi:hypothetical protein
MLRGYQKLIVFMRQPNCCVLLGTIIFGDRHFMQQEWRLITLSGLYMVNHSIKKNNGNKVVDIKQKNEAFTWEVFIILFVKLQILNSLFSGTA